MNERLEEMENKLLQATNEDDEDVVYASICAEAVLEDLQWTVGYAKKQAERVEELERELERIKVKYRVTKESHYNCSRFCILHSNLSLAFSRSWFILVPPMLHVLFSRRHQISMVHE